MKSFSFYRVLSFAAIAAFLLSAFLVAPAIADCDPTTSSDDTVSCSSDDSGDWSGEEGNDTMTQDAGVDIDGYVTGGEGDDDIVINGDVGSNFLGSSVTGDSLLFSFGETEGGDDSITINGYADGNVIGDGIISVFGDAIGGDDTIIIGAGGFVEDDVIGDAVGALFGDAYGGDDVIVISGEVDGDVYGDDGIAFFSEETGGDDEVVVTSTGTVAGSIYGGGGFDTLKLVFIPQALLDPLDPEDDSITYNGKYLEWFEFESLIGKILAALEDAGDLRSVIYLNGSLLGIAEDDGIKVFNQDGTVAFVPYVDLGSMTTGDSLTFQQPNSGGWYVVATDLGVNPDNGGNHIYQISIYNAGGTLQGQFTVTN